MMCSKMKFFISSVCVLTILFQVGKVQGGVGQSWEYDGSLGPKNWHTKYPHCGGRMQSPVDVETNKALFDPELQSFKLHEYATHKNFTMKLENHEGHTVEVGFHGEPFIINSDTTSGSLPSPYVLDQFHFHWGSSNIVGSEHTFDHSHTPLEMHVVHHMQDYPDIGTAQSQPYGLAVLAFFFKIGEENKPFNALLDHFKEVVKKGEETHIEPFPLWDLIWTVKDSHYFRYYGSLTTPPCYETVIWTLFEDRISISQEQMNTFRTLRNTKKGSKEGSTTETPISDDYRPTQNLNERRVTTNNPKLVKELATYIADNLKTEVKNLKRTCSSGSSVVLAEAAPRAIRMVCSLVAAWVLLSKLV